MPGTDVVLTDASLAGCNSVATAALVGVLLRSKVTNVESFLRLFFFHILSTDKSRTSLAGNMTSLEKEEFIFFLTKQSCCMCFEQPHVVVILEYFF